METVQLLRQLESTIVSDAKSANSLLDIKKVNVNFGYVAKM